MVRKHGWVNPSGQLDTPSTKSTRAPRARHRFGRTAIAWLVAVAYCYGFLVHAGRWLPSGVDTVVHAPRDWLTRTLRALAEDSWFATREWTDGAFLAIVGIVLPWLVMALLGRGRPSALGVRVPNRFGVGVVIVAYLASLPFLYWMVADSGLANYYLPHMRRAGTTPFLIYYAVNMLGEHFLLHGVLLAALRPGMRWPEPPAMPEADAERASDVSGNVRWAADFGTRGSGTAGRWHTVLSWLRLPRHCTPAVIGSASLFALVHVGKDPRELVLSVPGGIALAYLAYRTNSFLTPLVLHLATAGTALGMMVLLD